ncbi:hypothetical protein Anapl_00723 [Anas platyrhynchos]|uniref:Uncharacterized protein n=1 Tax=Anas platyrhynchos TaxID=8839 RepID=R0JSM6_ANAPL|nr:hypothetical protein Anapl_00723 [Anas platyrhynchos]
MPFLLPLLPVPCPALTWELCLAQGKSISAPSKSKRVRAVCVRQQQALHTTTLWHGGDEAANPTATESQSQKCKAQEKVNGKLKPTSSSSTLSADQLMTKNIMRSHRNHQKPLETTTFRNLPSVAWCKDKPQQLRRRTAVLHKSFLPTHPVRPQGRNAESQSTPDRALLGITSACSQRQAEDAFPQLARIFNNLLHPSITSSQLKLHVDTSSLHCPYSGRFSCRKFPVLLNAAASPLVHHIKMPKRGLTKPPLQIPEPSNYFRLRRCFHQLRGKAILQEMRCERCHPRLEAHLHEGSAVSRLRLAPSTPCPFPISTDCTWVELEQHRPCCRGAAAGIGAWFSWAPCSQAAPDPPQFFGSNCNRKQLQFYNPAPEALEEHGTEAPERPAVTEGAQESHEYGQMRDADLILLQEERAQDRSRDPSTGKQDKKSRSAGDGHDYGTCQAAVWQPEAPELLHPNGKRPSGCRLRSKAERGTWSKARLPQSSSFTQSSKCKIQTRVPLQNCLAKGTFLLVSLSPRHLSPSHGLHAEHSRGPKSSQNREKLPVEAYSGPTNTQISVVQHHYCPTRKGGPNWQRQLAQRSSVPRSVELGRVLQNGAQLSNPSTSFTCSQNGALGERFEPQSGRITSPSQRGQFVKLYSQVASPQTAVCTHYGSDRQPGRLHPYPTGQALALGWKHRARTGPSTPQALELPRSSTASTAGGKNTGIRRTGRKGAARVPPGPPTALGTPALGRSERVSQSWGSAATGDRCSKRANPPLVALVTKLGELPTRQKVILPLLASLNTVCSAVNHPVRGAKSQRRTSRNSSSSSQLDRPQNGSEQRAGDLQAACTKYLEKHLLDFKLHILVQNMKAMCASEGFKWPMKLTRFLSIELPRDQKLLEG